MIKLFRFENKWRMEIVNETLEFKDLKHAQDMINKILKLKEDLEPYGQKKAGKKKQD